MKLMMLAFAAAAVTLGASVPTHVSAAAGAAPATRVGAATDACALVALPVAGPLVCSALGM
jgi:hypothetical protein